MPAFKLLRAVCVRKVRQVDATFQSSMSGNACRLNRSMQHLPVYWFGNAFAGESPVSRYGAKTYAGQRRGGANPGWRFWLLFSMLGGLKLSVASTH